MIIEITDSRQEWLIDLGEKLAIAVRDEEIARQLHEEAYAKVRAIQDDIVRIGGYIVERKRREASDEAD